MTPIIIPISDDIVISAFKNIQSQINAPNKSLSDDKLESFGDQLQSALKESWFKIEKIVNDSIEYGWDFVKSTLSDLQIHINRVAESLGDMGREFKQKLSEHVRLLINNIFQTLLLSLQNDVTIGNTKYKLSSIELEHKLIISTSVQVSIQSLCQFLAAGELLVRGSYSV